MQTKLTLSIDSDVIEQAKEYAHRQHRSLSKLVENYLKLVTRKEKPEEITPIVASLSGILPMDDVEGKGRDEITEYLIEKYK